MKKLLYYFVIPSIVACWEVSASDVSTREWGPVTNKAQLSISLKAAGKEIKAGQAFNLGIQLRNLSTNQTFWAYVSRAAEHSEDFSFVMRLPTGKAITLTPRRSHGSGQILVLQPGQSHEIEFELSRLWKFDQPGPYQITAMCRVDSRDNGTFQIVSSQLSVVVVPDR